MAGGMPHLDFTFLILAPTDFELLADFIELFVLFRFPMEVRLIYEVRSISNQTKPFQSLAAPLCGMAVVVRES